jgi:protein gp37
MGKETGISWCHHTFNAWWGCTKVSPGCKNCYAETFSRKHKFDIWGENKPRRTFSEKHWNEPRKWNKEAQKENKLHTVFCGSMMDWAEDDAPVLERKKMWELIKETPFLMWLTLTKRPENILKYLPDDWTENYPNVALGTSIENNDYIIRVDIIRKIPAVVHFISAEPLLGPLTDLELTNIDWVIVGGESGTNWREMKKEWAIEIRDKCLKNNVSFFYKQGNGQFSGAEPYLDGVEYKQFPKRFSLL